MRGLRRTASPLAPAARSPRFGVVAVIGLLQSVLVYLMLVGVPLRIVRLGGGPIMVGLAFTAWAIGRSVTGYLGGQRYDRVGPRTVLVVSFCLFGLSTALYGWGTSAWVLVVGRLAQGVGAGLYWAGILATVGESATGPERMRRLSVFSSSVALGGIIGAVAGGWLMDGGISRVMVVAAILAATLVALAWHLPDRRPSVRTEWSSSLGDVVRGPIGVLSLLAAVSQLPTVLTSAGLPILLLSIGLGAHTIGMENALIVAGVLGGQAVLIRMARRSTALGMLPAAYAVAATTLLALAVSHAPWLVCASLAVLGASVQVLATLWVNAVQSAVSEDRIGAATGFMRASSDFMTAASYPLVGIAVHARAVFGLILAAVLGLSAYVLGHPLVRGWYGSLRYSERMLASDGRPSPGPADPPP